MLKSLGTLSQHKTKPGSIGLDINNDIFFDKSMVSEHFNNYFTNQVDCNGKYEGQHIQDFYRSLGVTCNSFCLVKSMRTKYYVFLAN